MNIAEYISDMLETINNVKEEMAYLTDVLGRLTHELEIAIQQHEREVSI